MTMLFIPTTWRRSNVHKYGRNNDATAPHVYKQSHAVVIEKSTAMMLFELELEIFLRKNIRIKTHQHKTYIVILLLIIYTIGISRLRRRFIESKYCIGPKSKLQSRKQTNTRKTA